MDYLRQKRVKKIMVSKSKQTPQTVAKPGSTRNKLMLYVWWDWKSIIHYKVMPSGITNNSDIYWPQLMKLKREQRKMAVEPLREILCPHELSGRFDNLFIWSKCFLGIHEPLFSDKNIKCMVGRQSCTAAIRKQRHHNAAQTQAMYTGRHRTYNIEHRRAYGPIDLVVLTLMRFNSWPIALFLDLLRHNSGSLIGLPVPGRIGTWMKPQL
ncbi:hypothetical protein EVAR_77160_1 [Eumeta japonica]|uniref:Mariner Mos1 transposase n=1 Tax=Eumeta variegata TaxID=151549 RepID=A0A4C1T4S7_EUMVA|nr:hypothetical protein EVAR_77160_1 [Eumeta japonica]